MTFFKHQIIEHQVYETKLQTQRDTDKNHGTSDTVSL